MSNYYEILSCDKNASYEELKKNYHDQVKKLHPDKTGSKSQKEFLTLDKAWKTLRDAQRRREYDLTLSKNELNETPLYCEIDSKEMSHDAKEKTYNYECRCGGVYVLQENQIRDVERVMVPCDECTFHIVVINSDFSS